MTDGDLFLNGLRALHAQLLGTARTIEMILELAERPSASATVKPEGCQHPIRARQSMSAMGHLNRFHCSECNQTVEG